MLCALLMTFSCGNEANTDDKNSDTAGAELDYDGMAQALCACMTPLMEVQEKVLELSAEGKTDEIQELLSDIEKLSEEGDKCVAKLEAKYGVVEGENEQKANAAFQKACPRIANMLENAIE